MTARPEGSRPAPSAVEPCHDENHCITCSDEGVPLRVLDPGADGLARCAADDGREETVETTLVGAVAAGDSLLVHAGVALVKLSGPEPEGAGA